MRLEQNPLRVLDCKVDSCQKIANGAPVISDFLCEECREHQSQLLTLLDGMGIAYELDARLVRGLDYYTKTVFEIVSSSIGSQSAVCGGGRYDGLVEEIGGPHVPAVGFGLGMERLLLVLENIGKRDSQARSLRPVHCEHGRAGGRPRVPPGRGPS